MKQTLSLRTVAVLLAAAASLAACGGSDSSLTPDPGGPAAGLLKKATSAAEFEASLKAGFSLNTSNATAIAGDALASGAPPSGSFTGTYTQEVNVDEFDAVRYDGEHLYVAPRRFIDCCFILAADPGDGSTNTGNPAQSSIRILATDPANAGASVVSSIPLEDELSVQGMYIADDRLLALTTEFFYGTYGDAWADLAIWLPPSKSGFRVYDVSNAGNPALVTDVQFDGVFVDSRRIGNIVYIVSRFMPNINGVVVNPQTAEQQAQNEAILANVTLDEMLPTITIDGNTRTLVDPLNCYVTNDPQGDVGYPVITSVTAVPIDNPDAFFNTCLDDEAYGVYVSENALYFPQVVHHQWPEVVTRIHKFALAGTSVTYRGSGDIRGQVWRGGQADFRMSESNGDLRVLASDYRQDTADRVDHLLYVLREASGTPALRVVSQLPNSARPAPIGKPNEELYGVRFLDDRAYAVTFEQIDPLYVIDLADPADPFIAGELEVTGFSDFLHPVSDALLLGLGTDTVGGVKLELFDVEDLSMPVSRGSVVIGDNGSWSEARWDRHAFTYQPDVNGVDRFTVPATRLVEENNAFQAHTALHLFEIHDKASPDLASLVPVGMLEPPAEEFDYVSRNRAFIHDDTVYYVQDESVWAAFWLSPTMLNGPF
ncbi:MAG: beta-propeller domain-containing protein [Woeseiaceae bacterium]|nr:beta-propeller domain-containing protein [Woeseiaceae bacterium]